MEVNNMNCKYSEKTAIKCGINSALIAGYLWDNMAENGAEHHSMEWIRCGKKSICAVFPFMGVKAVGNALKRLVRAGILKRAEYNDSRFDRTASYAFTEYGSVLMEETENDY